MNDTDDKEDAAAIHADLRSFIAAANAAAAALSAATLKGLLLINGGAAVAMLGFVASIAGQSTEAQSLMSDIAGPLLWFAWGVALTVFATGMAYGVMYLQAAYAQSFELIPHSPYTSAGDHTHRYRKLCVTSHVLAVVLASASLACFIRGVTLVAKTLTAVPSI